MEDQTKTNDFGFHEMQTLQKQLQEKYKDKWEPISPETGKNKLLWLVSELGEVVDIVKKDGSRQIMENPEIRAHFIEEVADVLMYLNDVLLCYDISVDELKEIYREKIRRNMCRW